MPAMLNPEPFARPDYNIAVIYQADGDTLMRTTVSDQLFSWHREEVVFRAVLHDVVQELHAFVMTMDVYLAYIRENEDFSNAVVHIGGQEDDEEFFVDPLNGVHRHIWDQCLLMIIADDQVGNYVAEATRVLKLNGKQP